MAIVRNRAELVLAAAMRENPQLVGKLSYSNCYVYDYGTVSATRSNCVIKGRYNRGLRGKVKVMFTKLDIVKMLLGLQPEVRVNGATTTKDLLPAINARYGFDLREEEIVDLPLENEGTTATLQVAATCSLYRGTVVFQVNPAPVALDGLVVTRDLTLALDVWPSGTLVNGAVLSLGHDYTSIRGQLSSVVSGAILDAAQAAALAGLFNPIDRVPWTATTGSTYSLLGAEVLFNGPTKDVGVELSPIAKGLFSDVLIIKPSKQHNTNMEATPVAFHYNVFK